MEEKVFLSNFDNGYPCKPAIIALNADSDIVWKYRMTSSVRWNIAYENGVIYAKDDIGTVHAVSAKDGAPIWNRALAEENSTESMGGLRVQNGEIYVSTNKRAFILDAKNGDIVSEIEYNDPAVTTTVAPVPFGNKVLWGKHWQGLICFDRKSGEMLWYNKDVIDFQAEPITVGDLIYAPTRYRIVKFDKDGNILAESERKSEKFFNSTSTPLYYKDRLFVPTT